MKHSIIRGMGASAVALLAIWSSAAFAQDSQPAAEAPQAADAAGQTEGTGDIIVTARLRSERLQDVPVAATAFSSEQLDRYQTNSFTQVAAQVPQLQIGSSGDTGGGVINLRGVGSPSSGPTIDQAVSINIDGIQFSQSLALALGLYDIDRVEILKGPQALFFGKNSPGGVISITSKGPGDKFEGSLRVGYEFAHQRKYAEAMVSGPLSDTIGARLDASYGNQNGWFRNDAKPIPAVPVPAFLGGSGQLTDAGPGTTQRTGPDQEDFTIRGTLAYKSPGGFLDATLKVGYGKVDTNNGNGGYSNQFADCPLGAPQFVVLLGSAGSRDCKLDRTYNETDIAPGVLAISPLFNKNGGKQFYINRQFISSATLNFHLNDDLTLTSVTGYYKLDLDLSGNFALGDLDFVQQYAGIGIKQFSQEARLLSSFSSPFNFMIGGFYQHVDNKQRNLAVFGSPLIEAFTGGGLQGYQPAVNNNERQKTEAYSFFGQAIIDITPQVQLTAGGRYSHERKSQSGDVLTPQVFRAAPVLNVPFSIPSASFNNFSPDVTLTYKPIRNLTVYAAYKTAFKSGGFDLNAGTIQFGNLGGPIAPNAFNQEKVKGFEVGAKGSLFDRQLSFDMAAYRYKYSDLQVSAFDSATFGYRITNAASATVQGVELSTQFRPRAVSGLSLRGTINYNDSHYNDFDNAPCYTGQSIALGCAFVATPTGPAPVGPGQTANLQDLTGRSLTRAPKWSGNVGATYEIALPGGLTLAPSADGTYTGSLTASPAHDARAFQREAWRLNASVALRGPDDRWTLSLIGTNLTQVIRAVNAYGLVATGSGTGTAGAILNDLIESPSEVRTVSLQGTVRF